MDEPQERPRMSRQLAWIVVVIALAAGVILALRFGPQVTPLIESLH